MRERHALPHFLISPLPQSHIPTFSHCIRLPDELRELVLAVDAELREDRLDLLADPACGQVQLPGEVLVGFN